MKANKHDAGIDLYAMEATTIGAHSTTSVQVSVDPVNQIPITLRPGFWGYIVPRSSYRKKGLVCQAIYDAGYDGPNGIQVTNTTPKDITIEVGERFAQLIIQPVVNANFDNLISKNYKRTNKMKEAKETTSGILELKKTFRVRTGHKLTYLPEGHKCLNPHGEYYTIILTLRTYESPENLENHMLRDFGDIDKAFKEVYDFLDHSFLLHKDDPKVELYKQLSDKVRLLDCSPTAEYLSKFIFEKLIDKLPELVQVEVIESKDNSAIWRIGI